MTTRIAVCTGCAGGAELADALAPDLAVSRTACMNVCARPASVSLRAEGKVAYLFAGVTPDMAGDLRRFAAAYDRAATGEIDDARPFGDLRLCLVGRIPA